MKKKYLHIHSSRKTNIHIYIYIHSLVDWFYRIDCTGWVKKYIIDMAAENCGMLVQNSFSYSLMRSNF